MPATDWQEVVPDDEAARLERHAAVIGEIQRRRAQNGSPSRALHAKANLGVEAEFEVLATAPADAKLGMFAEPKTYRALVRYSNGAASHQPDRKPDVRGIAIKVFGVAGKKLIPGMEDATTQDFLAIRTPAIPVRNADEFIALVRAAQTPALLPFRLIGSLGFGRAIKTIRGALAGLKLPTAPLAATTYYSALPITYGPHAIQYAFVPRDPLTVSAKGAELGLELIERLRDKPVIYDLGIRFYTDPVATPIEDASVEWHTPLVTVATLTLPAQDATSPRGKKIQDVIDHLAFDPWHARTDLRPLGNVMRARNHAYRASTKARNAAGEPTAWPTFD